jgi:hypothetical protein
MTTFDTNDQLIAQFRDDPNFFAEYVFNAALNGSQKEYLTTFRDNRMITTKGGSGAGKSLVTAIAVWWSLVCHDEVTVTVVGKDVSGMWKILNVLYQQMKPAFKDQFDFGQEHITKKANPIGCRANSVIATPNNVRGIAAINHFVFIVEAANVDKAVYQNLLMVLTDPNPKISVESYPASNEDWFHETWQSPHFAKVHIKTDVSAMSEEQAIANGYSAQMYRVFVQGEFPIAA